MDISSDIPSATDQTGSAVLQLDVATTATMDSSYQHLIDIRSSKIAAPPHRIYPMVNHRQARVSLTTCATRLPASDARDQWTTTE